MGSIKGLNDLEIKVNKQNNHINNSIDYASYFSFIIGSIKEVSVTR